MCTGKRRRHWRAIAAGFLLVCLLLTGCWDRREIEERSNVLASGVDVCEEGEDCRVVFTRQVAIPGRIPLGATDGGGGGADANSVMVIRVSARDSAESAWKMQAQVNRKTSMAHTRVLVVSEALARQGIDEVLDYEQRVPEERRLMWIVISEGKAEEVMRARPPLERVPALYLSDMIEDATKSGRVPQVFFGEFLTRMSNRGEETIAPLISMHAGDPKLSGVAVFRRSRMVGKLSPSETATMTDLRGLGKSQRPLHVPLPQGHYANLMISGRKTLYRLDWVQGRVQARLRIDMEGDLVQVSPMLDVANEATIRMIEKEAAAEVARQATNLMRRLQQDWKADVLGLGERIRAYKPAIWGTIKNWPDAFAAARFTYEVRVQVRRTGPTMR